MSEELTNPSFDINAKYKNMIETSEMIVDCYQSVIDKGYEPSIYASLAYDVKNYLPNLLNENRELKKQLEEKNDGFIASTEELIEYAEENERLKEQLEAGEEQYKDLVEEKEKIKESYDSLVLKHESQQKEFIEWLEECIETYERTSGCEFEIPRLILSKYKEIIRGRNGN